MAVNQETEGIIGKFFYYSTSSILIPKLKFIEIGRAYGLPKFKPAKESKASAYRCATTAVKDRVTVKEHDGTSMVYRIYCRDNKKENAKVITRELVKETPNSKTNEYKNLPTSALTEKTKLSLSKTRFLMPILTFANTVYRRRSYMSDSATVTLLIR